MTALTLIAVLAVAPHAPQDPSNLDRLALYNKIRRSTVKVYSEFSTGSYHGTGVAIRSFSPTPFRHYKIIVTNAHVIREGSAVSNRVSVKPYKSSTTLPAFVLFEHLNESLFYDLAILVVQDKDDRIQVAETVPNAEAYSWMYGTVYSCGHPRDEEFLVDDGQVTKRGNERNSYVVEHDALIEQGNSGGGLFDEKGRLAAINTWLRGGRVGMAQDFRSFSEIFSFRTTTVYANSSSWAAERPDYWKPGPSGALGPEEQPEGTSIFLLGVGKWRTGADYEPHSSIGTSDGSPKVVPEYNFGSLLVRIGSSVERIGRAHRGENGTLVLHDNAAIGTLKRASKGKIEFRINDAESSDNSGEIDVFYLVMQPEDPLSALRSASSSRASP
jgi:hypothetical protein